MKGNDSKDHAGSKDTSSSALFQLENIYSISNSLKLLETSRLSSWRFKPHMKAHIDKNHRIRETFISLLQ